MRDATLPVALALIGSLAPHLGHGAVFTRDSHQVAVGDFNQDERDDLLVIARDAQDLSGIVLSTSAGPGAVHQTWDATFLGIPWASNQVRPVIGNFNRTTTDRRDDVFLQRSQAGLHYVSLTDPEYRLGSTAQAFGDRHLDLGWSFAQRRIQSGDFNGDGRDDLYLQPRSATDVSAIVYADADGRFDAPLIGPTWPSPGLGGLRFSVSEAVVLVGDFNADGRADLLVQARPKLIPDFAPEATTDGPWLIPVLKHDDDSFGLVLASEESKSGFAAKVTRWSRGHLGLDWSPSRYVLHVGDFNGDRYDDLFFQPRGRGAPAYVVLFRGDGDMEVQPVANPVGGVEWDWSTASGDFVVGDFDGDGRADLYRLPADPAVGNDVIQLAESAGVGLQAQVRAAYAPVLTRQGLEPVALASGDEPLGGGAQMMMMGAGGFVPNPGSAVGAIPGAFSVDPTGAANYEIPIVVPPGVAGLAPTLALRYSSRAPDGIAGVGWALSGLSTVTRCPKTFAQDNLTKPTPGQQGQVSDGVDLDEDDRYCLDGTRLQLVAGSPSEYRTEIESFQRIRASGSAGNGPATFVVEDPAGLKRTYGQLGSEADALVKASGTNHGLVFGIKRIEDGFGNFIKFNYLQDPAAPTSHVPADIRYGRGTTEVARVEFSYEDREASVTTFLAGSPIRSTRRLSRVSTVEGTGLVREYFLEYKYSPTTSRAVLSSVVECERTTNTCLKASTFGWQVGARGLTNPANIGPPRDKQQLLDVDGSGVVDFVWNEGSTWRVAPRPHGPPVNTGRPVRGEHFLTLDYNGDGFSDLVQYDPATGTRRLEVLYGQQQSPYLGVPEPITGIVSETVLDKNAVAADLNGDGRDDIIWAAGGELKARISGTGAANSTLLTAILPMTGPEYFEDGISSCTRVANSASAHLIDDSRLRVVQFDSDGRADVLLYRAVAYSCWSEMPWLGQHTQSVGSWLVYSLDDAGLTLRYEHESFREQGHGGDRYPTLVDVNGDGLTDILISGVNASDGWSLFIADGVSYQQAAWATSGADQTMSACSDAPGQAPPNQQGPYGGVVETFDVNHCQGRSLGTVGLVALNGPTLRYAKVLDYNQDGKSDVVIGHVGTGRTGRWLVLRSTGEGFAPVLIDTGQAALNHTNANVVDINGDGLPDLFSFSGGSSPGYKAQVMRGPAPDLVVDFRNGLLDQATHVRYVALTSPAVYGGHENDMDGDGDPGNGTGGPPDLSKGYAHYAASMQVVQSFEVPGTNGSVVETIYKYTGAKANRQGRGFLGFSEVRALNYNAQVLTVNRYMQSFPWTGMVRTAQTYGPHGERPIGAIPSTAAYQAWVDTCEPFQTDIPWLWDTNCGEFMDPAGGTSNPMTPIGSLMAATLNTYGEQVGQAPASTPASKFPFVSQSVERRYNSTAKFKETTVTYSHDTYGNATQVDTVITDGAGGNSHSMLVVNQFDNVNTQDKWFPGRLLQTTVTHTRTVYGDTVTGPSTTRVSSFTYDPATWMLIEEKVESGADEQKTVYGYDAAGNRSVATATAAGWIGSRSTWTVYTAGTLRFPILVTNTLTHAESATWDGRHGVRLTQTDPNGLTTSWTYDGFGRMTSETAPLTTVTRAISREWCTSGLPCQMADAVYKVIETLSSGQQTTVEFDGLEREIFRSTTSPTGGNALVQRRYDPIGREYLISAPYRSGETPCWTIRKFDLQDRLTSQWSPAPADSVLGSGATCDIPDPPGASAALPSDGRLITYTYDAVEPGTGHILTTAYDAGRQIVRVHNVMDRLMAVRETPAGSPLAETTYDYDAQGNSTWMRDPELNVTRHTYTRRGFKTETVDPNLGTWSYIHNGFGELTSQTDAQGNITLLQYDALGRMTQRIEGAQHPAGSSLRLITDWFWDGAQGIGQLALVMGPYPSSTSGGNFEFYTYDSYARPATVRRALFGDQFWYTYGYDDQGRVQTIQYPASSGDATASFPGTTRLAVENIYNSQGALFQVKQVGTNKIFWELASTDARGQPTQFKQNAAGSAVVTTDRYYDRATGVVLGITAQSSAGGMFQNDEYQWDPRGNLTERRDLALAGGSPTLVEKYLYDGFDRLQTVKVTAPSINGGAETTYTNAYSLSGRILSRGASNGPGYTNYLYGTGNTSGAGDMGPHAVRQVTVNGVNRVYAYDNNGNLTSGGGRQVFWNVHNKPSQILYTDGTGTTSTAFTYGPAGERIAQYLTEPCVGCPCAQPTTNTYYIGGLLEKITKSTTALIEYRHYIQAGGTTVAVHTAWSNGNTRDEYVHHDHLGSISTLTSSTGGVVERFSYDPWGKRRQATTSPWLAILPGSNLIPASLANLTRGFTGHEHLDRVGLIHMNGRIYDPELGRFLSADPILQFPASTQGLDRYAYVLNNPVSLSDPSGHLVFGLAAALIGVKLAASGKFVLAALTAAIGGYLDTGSLKAGIFSAISAGFSFGVGGIGQALLEAGWKTAFQMAAVAVLHGLTQGILAVAQGGKFGAGFLSAAASSAFGPKGSGAGISDGKRLVRILQSAAVGGTASRIGGGKFANGAVTGAFVQAFNEMQHDDANGKRPKVTFEEGTEALGAVFSKHEALLNKTILDKLPGSVQEVVFELGETRTGGPMEADPRVGGSRGRVVVDRAYAASLASQDSRITAFQMGHEFFHIGQLHWGAINPTSPVSVWRAEVAAYGWNSANAGQFGRPNFQQGLRNWANKNADRFNSCAAAGAATCP